MTNVLVLGANGQIARIAERFLLADDKLTVTLFLRRAKRLAAEQAKGAKLVEGDATSSTDLEQALQNQDVVYANLAGDNIAEQAQQVVKAMDKVGVKRLIWISTLGIYDEVPGKFGEWNNATLGSYLTNYASAAKIIENSDLDYTIIRPAWLTNKDEVDYETTQKGEAFKGTEVSRKSIAALVYHLILNPTLENRKSLGVNKPNTDGDKPAWY